MATLGSRDPRFDAMVLLTVFGGLMAWTIWQGLRKKEDALGSEIEQELDVRAMPINRAVFWLVVGLVLCKRSLNPILFT